MEAVKWFNDNSGFSQALLVFALIVVTILYAWQTKKAADEAQRTRELQYRPEVVVYAGPPALFMAKSGESTEPVYGSWKGSSQEILLDIENIGLGPALDVKVTCSWNQRVYKLPTEPLEGMPPRGQRRIGVWYSGDAQDGTFDGLRIKIECKPVLGKDLIIWERHYTIVELEKRGVKIYEGESVEGNTLVSILFRKLLQLIS